MYGCVSVSVVSVCLLIHGLSKRRRRRRTHSSLRLDNNNINDRLVIKMSLEHEYYKLFAYFFYKKKYRANESLNILDTLIELKNKENESKDWSVAILFALYIKSQNRVSWDSTRMLLAILNQTKYPLEAEIPFVVHKYMESSFKSNITSYINERTFTFAN